MTRIIAGVSRRPGAPSRLAMLLFAAAALLAPALHAQTVDEVIAAHIQARGGMEKLKAVATRRVSGTVLFGSIQAGFLILNKRPDMVREEFSLQGFAQIQAYDGKGAWQIDPFGGRKDPMRMSEDDSKSLVVDSDMDGPLVDYKSKGSTAELMGHDSVEGTDCFKVKITQKNGDIFVYYLDADSHMQLKLETKMTIRGAIQENETYFGDYEAVDGIYYPFAFETAQKGDPSRTKFTVNKVEVNPPVTDSVYQMPAVKAPAKPAGSGQ